MKKWLIGCDPELILRDKATGELVSAEGLIPGTKLEPHKVDKGMIQVDGFAAEIGITPATSANEFADNVERVLQQLQERLPGHDFIFTDSVIFSDKVYQGQSEKGRELGCDPDWNAYTGIANDPPKPDPESFRTCAGHIHIGWIDSNDASPDDPGHFADCMTVAKQMDWALGVPNVYMNPKSKRRQLYGKAGAFRIKSYGVEYRTPDNAWLRSREAMTVMFDNAAKAMNDLYSGKHYSKSWNPTGFIDRATAMNTERLPDYLNSLGLRYCNVDPITIQTSRKRTAKKKPELEVQENAA